MPKSSTQKKSYSKKSKSSSRTKNPSAKKSPPRVKPTKKISFFSYKILQVKAFLRRRPHRSFRLTRRRDHTRSLKLPGFLAFTTLVASMLYRHKKIFLTIVLFYTILGVLLGNMASQAAYEQLSSIIREGTKGVFDGNFGLFLQGSLLTISVFSGGMQNMSEVQQVYAVLLFLFVWLTTVWLLREIMAGHKPRARDGIYNSASPLIPTGLIVLALLAQLIPIGVLAIIYTALNGIGMLSGGLAAFLFSIFSLLIIALTLYWITSTFIALVVVTLPGMYPWQAIRTAGDIVIGRRLRILYRLLWLGGMIVVTWFTLMIPIVLFDAWLKGVWPWFAQVPLAPIASVALGSLTVVWASSYIYLLYRRILDDDSSPA